MTFEEEVREALAGALHTDTRVRDGYSKHFAIVTLAPYVAAAIDASAERFVAAHTEEWAEDAITLRDQARVLALAALRGSGETPQP